MDVAIRDAMVPGLDGRSFFQRLRDVGVSAIEVDWSQGHASHILPNEGAAALRSRLDAEGVRACALLLNTDFSSPGADRHVGDAVGACRAAVVLGAPVVRIDPLSRDRSVTSDRVREAFVRGVERVLAQTQDTGVDLGIENHGPLANDPLFLDSVLAAVPDPRLGLTLDTGNFYWFGFPLESVYELVEKYAPAAKHTHLKNIHYPPELAHRRRDVGHQYKDYCCALHEGNLNMARVVGILRGAGFGRDLCIEDESLFKHPVEKRVDVLRREVDALRQAIREAGA